MDLGIALVMIPISWIVVCGLIAAIESYFKNRKVNRKKMRELHAEVCQLRAALERANSKSDYKLDMLRTELAIKELLLRQKWADATRRVDR